MLNMLALVVDQMVCTALSGGSKLIDAIFICFADDKPTFARCLLEDIQSVGTRVYWCDIADVVMLVALQVSAQNEAGINSLRKLLTLFKKASQLEEEVCRIH